MSFQRPGAGLDLFWQKVIRAIGGRINRTTTATKSGLRREIRTGDAAAVDTAVEQSTVLLEAHAEQVASTTQLGHVKESSEIPVAGDGTMTLGDEIPHAVDFTSDSQAAITASTTNDGSPAGLFEAQGEDGTGAVGTGEAAGLYGEASGASGTGVAGKASSTASTATGVAALLNSGALGDLFRGLTNLIIKFRVDAAGSVYSAGDVMAAGDIAAVGDLAGANYHFRGLGETPDSYAGQTMKYLRVNAGETAVEFATMPLRRRQFGWYMEDSLVVMNQFGARYEMDAASTIDTVKLNAKVPPTGAAIELDIKKATISGGTIGSWSSIFSVRPSIAIGAEVGTPGTLAMTTLGANDIIRCDIIQAGSTVAGSGVTFLLRSYITP